MIARPILLAGLLAGLPTGTAWPAPAETAWPEKPIRLVVGFGAGGPTDLPARAVAERLGAALGQRVVVENRVGAGGQLATLDVLAKPRDGYNLLLCTHFEAINAAVYAQPGFRLADLAPVSQIARYYYGIAITAAIPPRNWEEFLAYAQGRPDQLNFVTLGRGSAQEILAVELSRLARIRLTGVPYKAHADIMNDLVPGRVHVYVAPTLSIMSQYRTGRLRLLAVTSPTRLAVAPEVPALLEKGLSFDRFGWLGICAGAGTPASLIALLNRHIAAIVARPDYRELIENAGSIAVSSTPEELARIAADTHAQTARVIREFGLHAD